MTASLTKDGFMDLVQLHTNGHGCEIDGEYYEVILKAYGEVQRHYHTITHIHNMWAAWDHYSRAVQPMGERSDKVVKFAILFHEYVRTRRIIDAARYTSQAVALMRPHSA
jgi:predicted metal-dependent HD superfamily phosphohydrolase